MHVHGGAVASPFGEKGLFTEHRSHIHTRGANQPSTHVNGPWQPTYTFQNHCSTLGRASICCLSFRDANLFLLYQQHPYG